MAAPKRPKTHAYPVMGLKTYCGRHRRDPYSETYGMGDGATEPFIDAPTCGSCRRVVNARHPGVYPLRPVRWAADLLAIGGGA